MITQFPNMNYENYDPSFPDQPVVDLYLPVWSNLPAFKFKPAFIWVEDQDDSTNETNSSVLTYVQLNDSVQSISSQLLLSLQKGDTVVILCPPGLELVEIIFACQRAGLLIIPMFPPDPSFAKQNYHHLVRVLSQTKPKAAIARKNYINSVGEYISSSSNNRNLAGMLQNLSWISTDDIKNKRVYLNTNSSVYNGCLLEDVYLIQYTSGSTGIPKPVLVTAGSAAHNVRFARKAYDLHPNSVIVSWLPQYHDCGLVFLLLTIVSGATCVLMSPTAFVTRPRMWLELITNFQATCTPVPSFTLPLVTKRGGIDKGTSPINLWSLKNLILINEPIYKSSVQEFVDLFNPFGLNPSSISPSYGLAENNTFVSTAWRSNDNCTSFPNIPSHNKLLPSARLASRWEEHEDMEIVVVNEDTYEPVADGIEGEIWVSSPSNGTGYLGHPFLTREIFEARLRNMSRRCFVRTGDKGIVKGHKRFLFVTGRCIDVIKLANNREIHPHYIETAAYNSCPEYLRGGCLAAFEISKTIAVVAEMQRSAKDPTLLKIICEKIKQAVLKEENVEVGLVILVKFGNVPKTTSGKIQRWAAKDKLIGGKMTILIEMPFENKESILFSTHAYKRQGQEGRRRERTAETNEVFHSRSSTSQTRPSLLSLL